MSIFSLNLNISCVVRIWDILFFEGEKTIYRTALAILKINEKILLNSSLDGIFTQIKEYMDNAEPDLLIKTALNFTFSKELVTKLE